MPENWSAQSAEAVLHHVHSSVHGLSTTQARERLHHDGQNTLPDAPTPSIFSLFLSQFTSPLVLILVVAGVILSIVHDLTDALVIAAVLLINAIIGTFQEGKAQSTLAALRNFSETNATVLRDGEEEIIESSRVVHGDILLLREGDQVVADARILEAHGLQVNEATLTGETLPVVKTIDPINTAITVSDQKNMLFRGTMIATGTGRAVVIATGTKTQLGSIAQSIEHLDTAVPLKRKIDHLSLWILGAIGCFSTLFFVISILSGVTPLESLLTVITLTVSLVPEGLPVILTLILAMSVKRMSTKRALVKKLQAVEALGQATIIAVDKTGTITLNELCVERIVLDTGLPITVSGSGFKPEGELHTVKQPNAKEETSLAFLLSVLKASTDAHVIVTKEGLHQAIGDPTEAAFVVLSKKSSQQIPVQRTDFTPFDYHVRYSRHVFSHGENEETTIWIGAPETLLHHAHLDVARKVQIDRECSAMQLAGMRVVAVIAKNGQHSSLQSVHTEGRLLALIGMQDSIHPEASEAIAHAQQAGIRVIMITGDHADTARSIAARVGIYHEGDAVLTGSMIESEDDAALTRRLSKAGSHERLSVCARVTPAQKLRIIESLRANGEIVAMTGDGVNDAASLVAADLGIAMGRHGTEVAKEAADIVLLDDNFRSITAAIKEGRNLYIRIKMVILYLLSTGVGEAMTLGGALLLGFPAILSPMQVLWLNFVTDGFLNIGLAFEPREHGTLRRDWNRDDRTLVNRKSFARIILMGTTMAIGTLFVLLHYKGSDPRVLSTMVLTTLSAFQWWNAFNCRSERYSLTQLPFFGNIPLLLSLCCVMLLHFLALNLPFFHQTLGTTPLSILEWVICLGIGAIIILVEEVRKALHRH